MKTNNEHLLPCPFCGAQPSRQVIDDILHIHCPQCVSVGFHNYIRFGGTRADSDWNTRLVTVEEIPNDEEARRA